jgi:hypothetical protein
MPQELLAMCRRAGKLGLDFPAIWHAILRINPLVGGPPIQIADGRRIWLEIPLTTGQRLAYRPEDGFSLLSRVELARRGRAAS